MRALHRWVNDGIAIDAVVGYTNGAGEYRWQEPGNPCVAAVSTRTNDVVFSVALVLLILGSVVLTGALRLAPGRR